MAKSKKYSARILKSEAGWQAAVIRRMTSKKEIVTKSKDGFATEEEAKSWADTELKAFLERLSEQSKERAEKRIKDKEYDLI